MWLHLRAALLSFVLLGAMLGLPALGGYLAGGWPVALVLSVGVALSGGLATRYADRYLLRRADARRLRAWEAPDLFTLNELLAARAGLPAPRLYLVSSDQPNALTVGHSPETASVVVTLGLLRRLDLRELTGVLAHELAHIKHRDILLGSVAGSVTALMFALARLALWPLLLLLPILLAFAPAVLLAGAFVLVAPVLTVVLQAALARQREFAADAEAARLTGDPLGLAAALDRLRPRRHPLWLLLFGPRVLEPTPGLLDSHPPTPARIERLLRLHDLRHS